MIPPWANVFIEELRRLDREEAPHGLYGLREMRQSGERLPKLPAILNSAGVGFARRVGGLPRGVRPGDDAFSFGLPEPRVVHLEIGTYADTKVRKFGDTFRLDDASRVQHEAPALRRELPKLAGALRGDYGRNSAPRSFGFLLLGFFRREKDAAALLAPVQSPAFLDRYGLGCVHASWLDAHGRDLWTCLALWHADQPPRT